MLSLRPLPYAGSALEPNISGKTLEFHYGKHHVGYFNKLNELIVGKYDGDDLETIINKTCDKDAAVFNNAAQVFDQTAKNISYQPGTYTDRNATIYHSEIYQGFYLDFPPFRPPF